MTRFFLGITGASGHAYAEALLRALVVSGHEVDVAITEAAAKVMRHELAVDPGDRGEHLARVVQSWAGDRGRTAVRAFRSDAVDAPASSGTALTGGVVLCPCSMGTLARVSIGFSSNLVERAADVALKEGRKLVLVPRETPLSAVHLENMLRLVRLGAIVLPAMPGFYHRPQKIDDLVDHVVGKILDRLGVEHAVGARWKGMDQPAEDDGLRATSLLATREERDRDARA
jgi:4-hydroxy-3-polyprenylbenzoate decarboxylase